ncbi:MAG: MATE family efflux transporter [Oscillospiraceae bacterium]|nr:MATE family efflux transporter [Oscillospiraceae bacterium]
MTNKHFYRRVLSVALPMMIQNGITNFVQMLDNVMVGQVGTIPMSGVAIVNQLMFVFNLCIFGAASGAGIFTAQFQGREDHEGIRHTFRFKLLVGLLLSALGIGLFLAFGRELIGLYLTGEGTPEELAATMEYGLRYLGVMLFGLLPFALSNAYSGTLRECGETRVPMLAGIAAVLVNLAGNYILIFGHFGAPQLGVVGAAIATVISRYVELAIVAIWTHTHGKAHPFILGALRSFHIPGKLTADIIRKGMPLLINEFLWSTGMAFLSQCYSTRGLDVVAAFNIATTISQLSNVVFLSLGNAVGILMGQMLGAGAPEDVIRRDNRQMIRLCVAVCFGVGAVTIALSGAFSRLYNTTDAVRSIAVGLICLTAVMMPVNSYNNAMYFTLRSGGQTFVTFIFDSGFSWCVCVPVAFVLSRFTELPILPLYGICVGVDVFKVFIGKYLLDKGVWIRRIVD